MAPNREPSLESFVAELTNHQSRLWAFVFSLIAEPGLAADVFQETNRVLWEKAAAFDPERPFLPWAFAIARNQARAARQAQGRDRLTFDDDVVERLADRATEHAPELVDRQRALAECLSRLPRDQHDLVERHYRGGETLRELAAKVGKTANHLGVTMFRIRRALGRCIEGVLAGAKS